MDEPRGAWAPEGPAIDIPGPAAYVPPSMARTSEATPAPPPPKLAGTMDPLLRMAVLAGFSLLLFGLLVRTLDSIYDLRADEFDNWGSFWAMTLQLYGAFTVSATLVYAGATGEHLPNGPRVMMVLAGVLAGAAVIGWAAAIPFALYR